MYFKIFNGLAIFIGYIDVVSQHRAKTQGDKGQTKYLVGKGREFSSIKALLGAGPCVSKLLMKLGVVTTRGRCYCFHPFPRNWCSKTFLKTISLRASQQVCSRAGMWTQVVWFQSLCCSPKSVLLVKGKNIAHRKGGGGEQWVPSSIYRQRTKADSLEGRSAKKGNSFSGTFMRTRFAPKMEKALESKTAHDRMLPRPGECCRGQQRTMDSVTQGSLVACKRLLQWRVCPALRFKGMYSKTLVEKWWLQR